MPDLTGATWTVARKKLAALDVPSDRTYADTIYGNDTLPDEGEYDEWKVCAHDPGRGEQITDSPWVRLWLSAPENDCPAQTGEFNGSAPLPDRDDDGDPDYHDPFPGDRNRNSTSRTALPEAQAAQVDRRTARPVEAVGAAVAPAGAELKARAPGQHRASGGQ
ncbi:hypothetical protein [Streptomyces sp. SP17KL33]|uniref:hypothetical protein n=1 Tax=Streptomyces sp. SP17KL33 TaxID=3002534 RepID=UPI002E7A1687|nr:hypothetical protein [Streptomyces sp. SP17KL33]MEE1836587.1 hypothetical protein [Streptomyces sp. SP17KL33]